MNTSQIDAAIRERIEQVYQAAESKYGRSFKRPTRISYSLRGQAAGQAFYSGELKFNLQIALDNISEFLNRTPGHEAAHLISQQLTGSLDHGPVWREVMIRTGQSPLRCHSYVVKTPYEYACGCNKVIYFTTRRHNNYLNGTRYSCRICKTSIRPKQCCDKNLIPV